MRELVPNAEAYGYLLNPLTPGWENERKDAEAAAMAFGQKLETLQASTEPELERAFNDAAARRVGALAIAIDSFFASQRNAIVASRRAICCRRSTAGGRM